MSRFVRESAYYLFLAVVTSLLLIPAMDLLNVHLTVPFDYRGDAISGGVHIKNVIENGWIDYYPSLGAPDGRHGNDFPGADNLHLMIAAVMGLVEQRWAVVLNGYFLLTFPLAAMTAAWYFRVVGIGRLMAGMLAVLYAFAPYHFLRGEAHLYLAAYYVVPLAGVVMHRVATGEGIWARRPRRFGIVNSRTAGTVACLALLGTASSYYSIFTLMLLTIGAIAAWAHTRRWRPLLGVVAAQVLLMSVMVANMLPNLLYQREHGANLTALVRSPKLTEAYQLKLSQMLLPTPHHRIPALANLRSDYDRTFPIPSERPVLGLIAALGLLVLLVVAVVGVVRRNNQRQPLAESLRALSTLALGGFLIGTIGGLSTLFALFITDSLRGWNRIVIVLALFSLAAVGLLLDRAVLRTTAWLRRPVALFLALVVGSIGLLDQVPAVYPRDRPKVLATWDSDRTFAQQIQSALPRGAMVLQLPYVPFPESRVNGTLDSDPLRMYLHSDGLRWSNGGIKGRPAADWADQVSDLPGEKIAAVGAVAGFSAAVVDTLAYEDNGAAVQTGLARAVGPAVFTSADERFVYYSLAGVLDRLRATHSPAELDALKQHTLLHPVGYVIDGHTSHPSLALENPLPEVQTVNVTIGLVSTDRPTAVRVTWPDGTVEQVSLADGRRILTRRLDLPPGRRWVRVTTLEAGTGKYGLPVDLVRYRLTPSVPDDVLQGFVP